MKSPQKAVVTGGAGFIGRRLVTALLKEGYEVHVIDSLVAGKRENVPTQAHFQQIDIREQEKLTEILQDTAVLFHLAALPRVPFSIEDPLASHETNVDGTLSVLLAARDAGVGRVVYSSSASVYGNRDVVSLSETLPASPVHPYGLQKYIGEWYVRLFAELYKVPGVSLRYFNVYGPGLDPEGPYALAMGRFLLQRQNGDPLTIVGDGTQTRDFIHVDDVVRANLLAAASKAVGKGEVINIGTGHGTSINQLASIIGGERVALPPRIEPHDSRADIRYAKELLGWEPAVTLEKGVAELKREFGILN